MLAPSAHVDTFARDNLPPADAWPPLVFDPAVFGSSQPYPDRLNAAVELLDRTIGTHGADRRALVFPGGSWTYGELRDNVSQLANLLTSEFGIVPGNRVLLRMPNNQWLVAAWLAVLKAGRGRGHVDAGAARGRVAYDPRDRRRLGEPRRPSVRRRLDATRASGPARWSAADDDLIARLDELPGRVRRGRHGRRRRGDARVHVRHHRPAEGHDALPPRPARDRATRSPRTSLRPTPDDLFVGSPPIGFTFGLGGLVLFPMRVGAATLLLERADAGRCSCAAIARTRRDGALHRADRLPGDAGRARTPTSPACAAA